MILILLAMNQGLRLLDVIAIMAGVMHPGRFKPDRSQNANDFAELLTSIYSGKLVSPEISA